VRVIKIEAIQRPRRVAAYCRVSTKREQQEGSLRLQEIYYRNYICSRADWELAGIFSDEGSGRSARKRPAFLSLMEQALSGEVDIIITKSVSRFGRNLQVTMDFISRLKTAGVEVIFEKEGISTADPSSGMLLSMLALQAQMESDALSESIKWGLRHRAAKRIGH